MLHPLLQDLYELADTAQRRGVRLELHTAGEVGAVPDDVRTALADTARHAAAHARSVVRLTVLATTTELRLGGMTDGPLDRPDVDGTVSVECRAGTDRSWWEATWRRQSKCL